MADAFIYPLLRPRYDAISLALAEQIVRCLNNGNTEVAKASTRIFKRRAFRLDGVERAYALLVLREMYLANDQLTSARELSQTVRENLGDKYGLALNVSIDASIAYYEGNTKVYQERIDEITGLAPQVQERDERKIIEVTQQLLEIRALMSASRYVGALEAAEKAKKTIKSIKMTGTERLFNLALCFQARLYYFLQDYRNAERGFLRLIEQDWYIDEARTYLGRIKYHNNELAHAAEIFERSIANFVKKNNVRRICNCKQELARTRLAMGLVDEAERLFQETNEALQHVSDFPFERGRAFLGLAQCRYRRREFSAALEPLDAAIKIFDAIGNKQNQIRCRNLQAMILMEIGAYEQASEALEHAKQNFAREEDRYTADGRIATPHSLEQARVLRIGAILAARQGRYIEAKEDSTGAIAMLRVVHTVESDQIYTEVLPENAIYFFVTSPEEHDEVLRKLRTAHRIADYRRDSRSLIRIHLLQAACLASRDMVSGAASEFRKALTLGRQDATRHGQSSADVLMEALEGYLPLVKCAEVERIAKFINGLIKILDSSMITREGDGEQRSDLNTLRERLSAKLSRELVAHPGAATVSYVELLRKTVEADRHRFDNVEYFFERLKSADYGKITAAVRQCPILEEIAEFDMTNLPELLRITQKYYSRR